MPGRIRYSNGGILSAYARAEHTLKHAMTIYKDMYDIFIFM